MRRVHDLRLFGMFQRNLDDLDAELRTRRVTCRRARASRYLRRRTHPRVAGDVDVDVLLVAWVADDGVRMRPTTRLHVHDESRMCLVGDVDDANAAEAIHA